MGCKILATLLLSLALAVTAGAQSDRGTLTGTVTDPQGAPVPVVSVLIANTATGAQWKVQTTDVGNYTMTSLPAGVYELTVEHPGFQKFQQSGIRLLVAQTVRVDVELKIGSTIESVTVTADASLLKTESAEQSVVVTSDRLNELPVKFANQGSIRNPWAFVILSTGVSGTNQWDMKINGSPSQQFRILLDGMELGNGRGVSMSQDQQPSIDAIEEFTLQTSNFAAEYGQVGAGLINMTAKSGTNRFHGTAYEIMAHEAFNAAGPFTHARPPYRQHDFGGSLGGPVRIPKVYNGANRTFFFFNYERYKYNYTRNGVISVPSDAYRRGDLSYLLTGRVLNTDGLGRPILEGTIYDPASDFTSGGRVYRNPYPGNRLPQSLFDPIAVKILEMMPSQNLNRPGDVPVNNYSFSGPAYEMMYVPSIKIDHNITSMAKISGYWHWTIQDRVQAPDGRPYPLTTSRRLPIMSHTVRINYDHTITPTVFNHLGIGEQRVENNPTPLSATFDSVSELGLKGALVKGFPIISGVFWDMGGSAYGFNCQDRPTATETLTWVRGSHTLKFGGEWRIDTLTNISINPAVGTYNFSGEQTGLPAAQGMNLAGGSIGSGFASFLLGRVGSGSIANVADPQSRRQSLSLFAQDSWKVNRKLTLDYGLRWDYMPFWHEIHYRTTAWDPGVVNPTAGGLRGGTIYNGWGEGRINGNMIKNYPWAFGPRLGVAYQAAPKTVLRLGIGISYGMTNPGGINSGSGGGLGFGWNTLNFDNVAYGFPAFQFRDGLKYSLQKLYATNFDPGIRPSPGLLNSPPGRPDQNASRPPRMLNWSLGIQKEITRNLAVEATYSGNRGAWWVAPGLLSPNALSPEMLSARGLDVRNASDRAVLTSQIGSSLAQSRGFRAPYAGYPLTATVAQTLRPFPQFSTLAFLYSPLGRTWYDALQVKFTKRFSNGLAFDVFYTFSKTLGTVDGASNNVFNRSLAKSITSYDQPHLLTMDLLYTLPTFGLAQRNRLSQVALGGWQVGWIGRYASGMPIPTPGSQNNIAALLFQPTLMNRVPGQPLYLKDLNDHQSWDPNQDFVLNPAAWADPVPGEWGTAAPRYSDFRYRRVTDEQVSLTKQFRIREGMSLNVRFELFNMFNRMLLPNPVAANPLAVQRRDPTGRTIGGYGYINAVNTGGQRVGQLSARFRF